MTPLREKLTLLSAVRLVSVFSDGVTSVILDLDSPASACGVAASEVRD